MSCRRGIWGCGGVGDGVQVVAWELLGERSLTSETKIMRHCSLRI